MTAAVANCNIRNTRFETLNFVTFLISFLRSRNAVVAITKKPEWIMISYKKIAVGYYVTLLHKACTLANLTTPSSQKYAKYPTLHT